VPLICLFVLLGVSMVVALIVYSMPLGQLKWAS
jgi:hypothetical protein